MAKTDTIGLYPSNLTTDLPTIGITQTGSSGNYSYSVTGSDTQGVNCPIFDVSWGSAARFCNWLQNGQPTFPAGTPGEVAGSTETGAYTLNGDTTSLMENRNAGAKYVIPSENEWYKAAYYKGGSTNAGYWTYPTQNNAAPSNVLSATGTNNANYYNGSSFTAPANDLTPVAAFSASPGPYGTYDMGGDVLQWDEASGVESRGLRGYGWNSYSSNGWPASNRSFGSPTLVRDSIGFRVAIVPEPGSITLLACGVIAVLIWWRRRV